jgi:hypothetical protein
LAGPVVTSGLTVERDLGKRPCAQRFLGGLLTRKTTEVQLLERENGTLKRLLADAELEKAALKEIARGNF